MSKKLWNLLGRHATAQNSAYPRYRKAGMELNHKMLEYGVDDAVFAASARALRIKGAGRQLVLESESELSVLMDYALYEYHRDGRNIVDCYQAEVGGADAIERELLPAMLTATTGLFRVESISPADWQIHLRDLIQEDRMLALTDRAFSQTLTPRYVLFFRPIVLPTLAMTSGFTFVFPLQMETALLRHWHTPGGAARGGTLSAKRYATFFRLNRQQGIETRYREIE